MAQRSRYSQEVRERAVRIVALFCIAGVSIAPAIPIAAEPTFILKEYEGFTVVIDCRHNGPIAYWMTLSTDTGNEPRLNRTLPGVARLRKSKPPANASIAGRSQVSPSTVIVRHMRCCAIVSSRPHPQSGTTQDMHHLGAIYCTTCRRCE